MAKAVVVQDANYPNMHRLQYADGTLSDMMNLARANEAATTVQGPRIKPHRERVKDRAEPRAQVP